MANKLETHNENKSIKNKQNILTYKIVFDVLTVIRIHEYFVVLLSTDVPKVISRNILHMY